MDAQVVSQKSDEHVAGDVKEEVKVAAPPEAKVEVKDVVVSEVKAKVHTCDYVYSDGRKHGRDRNVFKDGNGNFRCPMHFGKDGSADELDDSEELQDGINALRDMLTRQLAIIEVRLSALEKVALEQSRTNTNPFADVPRASSRPFVSLARAMKEKDEKISS